MANTSQALDLEGLHREMHGIAEQIRIIKENNVCLIQHLTKNNPPFAATPIQEEVDRSHRSRQSSDRYLKVAKAQVGSGTINQKSATPITELTL